MPIGFRQAHAGVRNAELLLARERAILRDQQREVIHEVADAIAEMDRTFVVAQTSYNRLIASRQQHQALEVPFEENKEVSLDLLLDAQRRLMDSEVRYYRALAEYALAAKNVHFVKGTLLDYDGVYPGRRSVARRGVSTTRPTWNRCAASRGSSTTRRRGRRSSAGARCRKSRPVRRQRSRRLTALRSNSSRPPQYLEEPASALVPTPGRRQDGAAQATQASSVAAVAATAADDTRLEPSPSGLVPAMAVDKTATSAVVPASAPRFPAPEISPKRLPPATSPPTSGQVVRPRSNFGCALELSIVVF